MSAFNLRDHSGREYPISKVTRIGRDTSNEIILAEERVSRHHATVREKDGTLYLQDESSSNGTFVNGSPIQQTALQADDQITIGDSTFVVTISGSPQIPGQKVQSAPSQTELPQKKKRSRVLTCLMYAAIGLVILVCGLVTIGGTGYYLLTTGEISQREILSAIGMGTGEISIVNLTDSTMDTTLIRIDTESGNPDTEASQSIEPLDIMGFGGIEPGRFQLEFNFRSGVPADATCSLQIVSGDVYRFVAVPEGIVLTREKHPAQSEADLNLLTSSLCRQ